MRIYGEQVFDDTISGTTNAWYSPARYDELLGRADLLAVMAVVSGVSGTATLNLEIQHSGDGRHWSETGNDSFSLSGDESFLLSRLVWPTLLGRIRLKASLTGTNPSCRLKLFVTGRAI
jgi:hypothetical protein